MTRAGRLAKYVGLIECFLSNHSTVDEFSCAFFLEFPRPPVECGEVLGSAARCRLRSTATSRR